MPVPSTGTFRIYPLSVASKQNTWQVNSGAIGQPVATDNMIATALKYPNQTTPALGVTPPTVAGHLLDTPVAAANAIWELYLNPDSSQILFNPGGSQQVVDLLSSDFPMGFLGTGLKVVAGTSEGNISWLSYNLKFADATILTQAPAAGSTVILQSSATAIIPALTYWGIDRILNRFGMYWIWGPISGAGPNNSWWYLYTTGSYILWSSTLTQSPARTQFVQAGDEVVLSNGANTFTQLSELQIGYTDQATGEMVYFTIPSNYYTLAAGTINLTLPYYITPYGGTPFIITGIGNGVQFSGSVPLAQFNSSLADASGIYVISTNKRNDTMYDRSTTPDSTTDVAIPNPQIRTGYIGG